MGKLGVPKELQQCVIQEAHDLGIGGNFRAQRTTLLGAREFYWKEQAQDVKRYVRGYSAYYRAKSANEKPYGLLQSPHISSLQWERINMDFITKLPATVDDGSGRAGNDTIITFIDSLTKQAHWVAAQKASLTGERFPKIFMDRYFCLHGLPAAIVSDRDT
jgi:hypothetical protein